MLIANKRRLTAVIKDLNFMRYDNHFCLLVFVYDNILVVC